MRKTVIQILLTLILLIVLGEAILDRTYYDILGNFIS
jgi:hypothetical protein